MLIGGGGIMQGNSLINDELSFIGRGKILARILQRGNEARLIDSSGKLDAMATEAVDADGTYIGRDGLVKKAVLNRLRFGQDGALIEGARTNDAQSDGSGLTLVQAGGSITRDVDTSDVTDPLGTNTATKWIFPFSEISSSQYLMIRHGFPSQVDSNESIWMRGASGGEQLYMFISGTPNVEKLITLTTSWQRFTVSGGLVSWGLFGQDRRTASMSGALSDATIYTWAINIENEGLFSTSSIVNPDALGVLRAADDIRYANVDEVICKAAQGTIFIAATPAFDAADHPVNAFLMDTKGTKGSGHFIFHAQNGAAYRINVYKGGSISANIVSSVAAAKGVTVVLALSWAVNDFRFYVNGILEGSDLAGVAPTLLENELRIGARQSGVEPWFGEINRGVITEPVLSARQVENVTAILRKAV